MFSTDDTRMMARALRLARRGRFWARPNPHVGCVLVRGGEVIGEGFTQPAGGNHAEIEALAQARKGGGDARGATAYVTLEPCNHSGRTGPCADALAEAGVTRVVAALVDPNPRVAGSGLQKLRDAGIDVQQGLLEDQARHEIAGFISRMAAGRPRIRAKLAMSLDGRTAMASGESQWITGPGARADVQRLRAASCAVVTGVDTVLADDCALTLRPEQLDLPADLAQRALDHPPQRVVLDSRLRTPAAARVLTGGVPTLLLHRAETPLRRLPNAELGAVPGGESGLDLVAVVEQLAARQFNEILVESGPRLAGGLLQAGLLDELLIYMAPTLMGSNARPLLQLPLDEMADKVPLSLVDVRQVGVDWRITAVPG